MCIVSSFLSVEHNRRILRFVITLVEKSDWIDTRRIGNVFTDSFLKPSYKFESDECECYNFQ